MRERRTVEDAAKIALDKVRESIILFFIQTQTYWKRIKGTLMQISKPPCRLLFI